MRRLNLHRAATVGIAAAMALGAGAIYAAASDDLDAPAGGTAPTEQTAEPAGKPDGTYAALSRSDERPSGRISRLIDVVNQDFDINPDEARATTAVDGTKVWIIPAKDGICFGVTYDDGPAISCATAKELANGQLPMSARDPGEGQVTAHYLVSDDVDALEVDGKRTVPTNNTVVLHYKRGSDVTTVGRDGQRRRTVS